MSKHASISKALELCGFVSGDKQESRLMNLLSVILKLQTDPPIPLTFSEIYDQLMKEEPESKLTKAWVYRVLKSLVETQLVRLESPSSRRKRYIADVNTVMAGLEQIKSDRIRELESKKNEIDNTLQDIANIDCGELAQHFVKSVTGTQQKISSRIVRGVDDLHRVLRYNMLDVAKKGDIVRLTALWLGPFVEGAMERTIKFIETAQRGVDVRYMVSTEVFRVEELAPGVSFDMDQVMELLRNLGELRKRGVKFDIRIYEGPKTYNQVSLNRDNMALIIAENPVTATWITREFNPDLIDNAVKAFDRDWKKSRSFLELTPKDLQAFGVEPGGLISKIASRNGKEKSD
jgi:Fe2+ or Zn2+ uptake regulation protein